MYVLLTLLVLAPVAVGVQVGGLYLGDRAELRSAGERQASSFVDLPALRGAVTDQAGRVLAVNTTRYDLALDPTQPGFDAQAERLYANLARLTGRSAAYYRRRVAQRSSRQYVALTRNLAEDQRTAVEGWEIPGLILEPTFSRRFNYGTTAAHVLGHVSADGTGLAGLEAQYNDALRGEPGRRAVKRDRRNHVRAVVGGAVVEPKHGESLVLTIDLVRQTIMEEELQQGMQETGARWGTAIAMDPRTGAILGMANQPTYDPNRASAFGTRARRNYALTDRMEPGSTFKVVGAAAAIEQGLISMQDSVETGDGWAVFHGRTMRDIRAYGTITFEDVLAKSSNVGMARVLRQMDRGVFYQYARNLGFGQPTWIDLPGEVGGTLRRPAAWSGTSLTSLSIGYEVDVTPLQVLSAYSALANGGTLMQPFVLAERRSVTGASLWKAEPTVIRQALKPETVEALRPALIKAVEEGTATRAQVEGLSIAGKTGTARKAGAGGYTGAYRSSFVGFFPADDPVVAMIVVLDEPQSHSYGGVVAAPIFQRIAERWAGTFPEQVDQRRAARAAAHATPDADDTAPDASSAVRTAALTPAAEAASAAADLDALARQDSLTAMPDLRGHSTRAALHLLWQHGIDARVDGHGRVEAQQPAPGAAVPQTVTLTGTRSP